jgi:hypothetical protein
MLNWLTRKKEAPPPFSGVGQRVVYGLGALAGLAILAPIAALALHAVTSIAMAIVVAIGICGTLMVLPAMGRWWKIQVLKMMKATARRNPVETLELELIGRQKAYEAARKQVTVIVGKSEALREQLDDLQRIHKRTDPGLEKMYTRLSGLAERLRTSLGITGKKLEEFKDFVAFQRDRWEIAKSTGELASMLRDAQGGDVTDRFLADTAIDSIRTELSNSFAQIDDILGAEEVKAAFSEAKMIDVTPAPPPMPLIEARTTEPVKLGRK